MKYVDEFRDPAAARALVESILGSASQLWRIMEICGGQTHTLIRSGIDELLQEKIQLIHGPGCPVCVTPLEKIDRAHRIAARPEVILASYGDMLRVPGSKMDLLAARAAGAKVKVIYSPLDALRLAEENPEAQVVFFAVGFETTAPANAMAVRQARARGLSNFSILASQVRVPPAIELLLQHPDCKVEGFIAPGHVCTVVGLREYEELARRFSIPFVVGGFEPLDLLGAIDMLVGFLEEGRCEVGNHYGRSVRPEGNPAALKVMEEIFEPCDMNWRGIGNIPGSGLKLREAYRDFDAELRFEVSDLRVEEPEICIAGEVLQGMKKPPQCPAFGGQCTPEHPLGAPMVSAEGACSAYYSFRRVEG